MSSRSRSRPAVGGFSDRGFGIGTCSRGCGMENKGVGAGVVFRCTGRARVAAEDKTGRPTVPLTTPAAGGDCFNNAGGGIPSLSFAPGRGDP